MKTTMTPSKLIQIGYTMFILLQTPTMVVDKAPNVAVAPLSIAASYAAAQFPDQAYLIKALYFPGNWVREAFVPYLICMIAAPGIDECKPFMAQLWDPVDLMARVNVTEAKDWFEANVDKNKSMLLSSCYFISVLGLFSYMIPLKMSIFGFIFLTFAMLQADVVPMPPFLAMSFIAGLVAYYFGDKPLPKLNRIKPAVPEERVSEPEASALENN